MTHVFAAANAAAERGADEAEVVVEEEVVEAAELADREGGCRPAGGRVLLSASAAKKAREVAKVGMPAAAAAEEAEAGRGGADEAGANGGGAGADG